MKKFEITYDIIGTGKCIVEAENENEATSKFNDCPAKYINQESEEIYRDVAYTLEIIDLKNM